MARKLHVLRLGPGEERILLAKLQAGERGAFRTLHHHYIGRVLGLAQQLLGSAEAAEDAAQETFLRVFRNLHRFRGDASLATWIHRIAINVCFSELKRRQRRIKNDQKLRANEEVLELEAVSLENPTLALENRILAQQLSRLLSELDPKKQATFYLRHVEGLSADEVAAVLEDSRDAVIKRLQRVLREILTAWQQQLTPSRSVRGGRS